MKVTVRPLDANACVSDCDPPTRTMSDGWSNVIVCAVGTGAPAARVVNERMLPVSTPSVSVPAFVVPVVRK